jgi:hypothetical protein
MDSAFSHLIAGGVLGLAAERVNGRVDADVAVGDMLVPRTQPCRRSAGKRDARPGVQPTPTEGGHGGCKEPGVHCRGSSAAHSQLL